LEERRPKKKGWKSIVWVKNKKLFNY
jgi:hypothetical protein